MNMFMIEKPSGELMNLTLSPSKEGSKKLAVAGSCYKDFTPFEDDGYKVVKVKVIKKSPTASLEQVKRDALFDLINNCNCTAEDDDGDPMLYVSDIISYINSNYTNNLKEKG